MREVILNTYCDLKGFFFFFLLKYNFLYIVVLLAFFFLVPSAATFETLCIFTKIFFKLNNFLKFF